MVKNALLTPGSATPKLLATQGQVCIPVAQEPVLYGFAAFGWAGVIALLVVAWQKCDDWFKPQYYTDLDDLDWGKATRQGKFASEVKAHYQTYRQTINDSSATLLRDTAAPQPQSQGVAGVAEVPHPDAPPALHPGSTPTTPALVVQRIFRLPINYYSKNEDEQGYALAQMERLIQDGVGKYEAINRVYCGDDGKPLSKNSNPWKQVRDTYDLLASDMSLVRSEQRGDVLS